MGGFFYISKADSGAESALATSRKQFAQSGFKSPIHFASESYALDYYPKILVPVENYLRFDSNNFILAVGTFIYRGAIGPEALSLFYDQTDYQAELHKARGHYVILMRKDGQTQLLRDPLASYEVFVTRDNHCVTSSFLAACSASNRRTISTQETYEYVFSGVCLGTATPFAEVRRLDLFERMQLELAPKIVRETFELCPPEENRSRSELVERNLEGLLAYASDLSTLFGDNIKLALSGGYDSRLLLALLRNRGTTPQLFVYGDDDAQDVRLAKAIARAEAIPLRHLNKALLRHVTPDAYPTVVRENFYHDDALNSDGIFVSGAEQIARAERNANGGLHVNGGGGEVFRNFFYLLDRPLSARQFVWTFYSRFDPSQCTALFDARSYEHGIAQKVIALFSLKNKKLTRREVECLYPYFRCRSWFGRENSVNNRYGYSVLPFFDHRTVREALCISIRYKYFGNFESALIRHADPSLARHPSNYGYGFDKDAPPYAAARWLLTYLRPPWLRRLSFRVKARLEGARPRPPLLSPPYLERVIDTTFPYMSRYFNIGKVTSDLHFGRICTLEYVFARLSAR